MPIKNNASSSNQKNEPSMEDWIGQLPDDIIGAIFSHLTMKEAGRTSVLSHRWKNLWTLTPHLNFDGKSHLESIKRNMVYGAVDVIETERRKYIKWVDQLMESHRGSELRELVVIFALDERHSCHLDKWIYFALSKRVKAVKINLFPYNNGSTKQRYSFTKSAPSISGIGCLTSLCLKYIDITGETIEQFLSVCPLLERLSLEESVHISNLRIVGSSLKLKYLKIFYCVPLESFDLSAPNLVSFHFKRAPRRMTKLQVDGLCCLVDLCINNGGDINYEWRQFSGYFPQLATLALRFQNNEANKRLFELPSQFTNLMHLSISIFNIDRLWVYYLSKFINLSCPLLHKFTLELPKIYDYDDDEEEEEIPVEWANHWAHQRLKVVEILQYAGQSDHIEIVKYFLKFAINLEKLIIHPRRQFSLSIHPRRQFSLRYPNWALDDEHDERKPGSRKRAEQLRKMLPPGVELLIM